MGDYINTALATWNEFRSWSPPTNMYYPMLALSVGCAFIISVFVSAPRLFSVPIGFIFLMFASTFSNFLARDYFISGLTDFQKTIMFSIIGNCFAAIVVLAIFKVSEKR
jgi:hypothetical protein